MDSLKKVKNGNSSYLGKKFIYKGTGLCISTPFGSTAYNKNNGGVVLPLEDSKISVTGIVCEKPINKILGTVKPLEIEITTRQRHLCIYSDGIVKECYDIAYVEKSVKNNNYKIEGFAKNETVKITITKDMGFNLIYLD